MAAVFAAASPLPARAGSLYVDAGIGGAAVSLHVDSFQEQKYRNTVAQQHDFSCGSAALATLLSYNYNRPVSETDVFKDMIVNGDQKVISESGFSCSTSTVSANRLKIRALSFALEQA